VELVATNCFASEFKFLHLYKRKVGSRPIKGSQGAFTGAWNNSGGDSVDWNLSGEHDLSKAFFDRHRWSV